MIDFTNARLYSVKEEGGKTVVLRKEGDNWFGPFPKAQFYDVEKSKDVVRDKKITLKSVEFVFTRDLQMNAEKKTALVFVEVKKSLPKLVATKNLSQKLNLSAELKKLPDVMPRNLQEFLELLPNKLQSQAFSALENLLIIPKTVDNVCAKFIDSWRLLLSVAYNREKSDDIPSAIIESVRNTKTLLVFIWVLDIDENEIVESMAQDVDSTEEKLRRAQNMIIEALGIAQMTLQQQLDERLRIERKICQTQIYVVTIEQARKMGLLPSNPI